jgi:acetate---CoA ligase (ADP-forming)
VGLVFAPLPDPSQGEPAVRLDRLMAPSSIAVVGASPRVGTYGNQALANLVAAGYPGRIHGVHPNAHRVHGIDCVPSLADLPEAPDAVVIATPADTVPELVDQAGRLGCGGAVVFAAGFAESGNGRALQDELVAAAHRHQLPVCGPNGNGIIALRHRAVLWGDAFHPRPAGSVALVSQSGNIAVNAIAARRGLLLHTVVSGGNQAVLDAADYLNFLSDAPGVRSVALYLENDCDGSRLAAALARCIDNGTGVAVLKAGQSPLGRTAAAAHTGAVAGDARVLRALVEEAGGSWTSDPHELLELAKTLAVHRTGSGGRGTAVVTCSGGDAATAADQAERFGIRFPPFHEPTVTRLAELLPAAATIANPLDYTALIWGDTEPIAGIVAEIGADSAVDQILVFYDRPLGMDAAMAASWDGTLDGVIAGSAAAGVPVVVAATLPELLDEPSAIRLVEAGIAPVAGLASGLACTAMLGRTPGLAERLRAIAATAAEVRRRPRDTAGAGAAWLAEHEAKRLLTGAGIPVPASRIADSVEAALEAADELGYPVALKLTATDLLHKSDIGALLLNVADARAVRDAYGKLRAVAGWPHAPVLVERMAAPGMELLVSARRDGVVPHLIVGLGGIWVELLKDVAVLPLPASPEAIERALDGLAGASLLRGGRGRPAVDVAAVSRLAASVGALLLAEDLNLIELNPVIADPNGAIAVDALIRR